MIIRLCHRFQCICSALARSGARCFIYSFLIVPCHVLAQVGTDTVSAGVSTDVSSSSVGDDDTNDDGVVRTVSFRPEDVQLQKRYRPCANDTLFPGQWWRRLFLGVGGGFQGLSDNAGSVQDSYFNVYLGYKFNPVHSLRLHGTLTTFRYGADNRSAKSIGAGIDYLANLTNFAWGYDRSRLVDVSTVVGAGVRLVRGGLPHKYAPYAHIGAHADLHLSSNFSLFAEPYVGLHRGMDVLFARPNREVWNLMYGANVGLQMTMERRTDHYTKADSIYRHFFFDSSIGLVVPGRSGGIMHRAGTGYQAAVGMWLNPMLGLRLGAQAQSFRWNSVSDHMYGALVRKSDNQAMFSGRIEMILNPMNFMKHWRNAQGGHDFDLNLLFGGDFGWNTKANVPNTTNGRFRCYYYGFTGAAQVMYRISNPGTYIFIEPRYLAAMYNVPYLNTNNSLNTVEHSFSLNVGTRLYMTGASMSSGGGSEFVPHWWAGADIGGVKWQKTQALTTGGLGYNPSVGLFVGYDWKRYASFRAQLAYQRLFDTHAGSYVNYDSEGRGHGGSGLWKSAYDVMDFRLSYMLNLNNLFQGYDSERRFNMWLTAGPTLSYVFNQSDAWVEDQHGKLPSSGAVELTDSREGKVSPGVSASLMAALRVAPQYDLLVEALGQYNFIAGTNPGSKPRLNNIKYGLTVGTRYHFVPGMVNTCKEMKGERFFFDSSYSWASSSVKNFFRLGGTQYAAALGMWLNPIVGGRLGLNAQTMQYSSSPMFVHGMDMRKSRSMVTLGGRAELMMNPLNLFNGWREKEGGHDFETNLLVGAEVGGLAKANKNFRSMYYGITGAVQLMYRVNNPGTYIFVEPRFLSARYKEPYPNSGVEANTRDNMFALGVGTRVYMSESSSPRSDSGKMLPHWWAGLDFGGVKLQHVSALHRPKGLGFNPTLSMSVGYDYKPLASFRAQLSWQRFNSYVVSSFTALDADGGRITGEGLWERGYNVWDLRLGYMFNVNNFLQGYDASRKFNVWLTAGPVLAWIGSETAKEAGQTWAQVPLKNIRLGNSRVGKVSPAVYASMMTTLKVGDNVDVTAEVLGQFNLISGTGPGTGSYTDNIKYGTALGVRYHFDQDQLNAFFSGADSKPWQKGWELNASYGWAMPLDTGLGMHAGGSSMSMSAGYWFNRLLGARFGLSGQQTYYRKHDVGAVVEPVSGMQVHAPYSVYYSQLMLGGRAEVMLSPLNLLRSRRERDTAPRWDMSLSAGMNFGGMHKTGGFTCGYVGFTTAAAALYRLSSTVQLYLEPRYDVFNYSRHNDAMNYDDSFADRMFTVSVGTRISRPVGESREDKRSAGLGQMSHRGLWVGGSIGGAKMIQNLRVSGGMSVQPSIGLAAGYDLGRLSSLRANLFYNIQSRMLPGQPYEVTTASGMNRRYRGTIDSRFHQMDLQLLYMLNVTNLWTGYDKRNSLNMYLEAGPMFSTILAQGNALADGEVIGGTGFRYLGNDYSGRVSMGMAAGALVAIPLSGHWDITAEVMGQYYLNRNYMPEYAHNLVNGIKINFGVGTRYNF